MRGITDFLTVRPAPKPAPQPTPAPAPQPAPTTSPPKSYTKPQEPPSTTPPPPPPPTTPPPTTTVRSGTGGTVSRPQTQQYQYVEGKGLLNIVTGQDIKTETKVVDGRLVAKSPTEMSPTSVREVSRLTAAGWTDIKTDPATGKVVGYTRPAPEFAPVDGGMAYFTYHSPTSMAPSPKPTGVKSYTTYIDPFTPQEKAERKRQEHRAKYAFMGAGMTGYFTGQPPAQYESPLKPGLRDDYFRKEFTSYYGMFEGVPQVVGREMKLVVPSTGYIYQSTKSMIGEGGIVETTDTFKPVGVLQDQLMFKRGDILGNIETAFTRADMGMDTKVFTPAGKFIETKTGTPFSDWAVTKPMSLLGIREEPYRVPFTDRTIPNIGQAVIPAQKQYLGFWKEKSISTLAMLPAGMGVGYGISKVSPFFGAKIQALSYKAPATLPMEVGKKFTPQLTTTGKALTVAGWGIKTGGVATIVGTNIMTGLQAPPGEKISTTAFAFTKTALFFKGVATGQTMYEDVLTLKSIKGTKFVPSAPHDAEKFARRGQDFFVKRAPTGKFEKGWGRQFVTPEVQKHYLKLPGGEPFPYAPPKEHMGLFKGWADKPWRPVDVPSAKNIPTALKGKVMGTHLTTAPDIPMIKDGQLYISGKGHSVRFARIGVQTQYELYGDTFVPKGSPKAFQLYAEKSMLKQAMPKYEGRFLTTYSPTKPTKGYVWPTEQEGLIVPGYKQEGEAVFVTKKGKAIQLEFVKTKYHTEFMGTRYPLIDKVAVFDTQSAKELTQAGFKAIPTKDVTASMLKAKGLGVADVPSYYDSASYAYRQVPLITSGTVPTYGVAEKLTSYAPTSIAPRYTGVSVPRPSYAPSIKTPSPSISYVSTPSKPSEVFAPSRVSRPSRTSRPSVPSVPSRPSMPSVPSKPSTPSRPSRPSIPSRPSTPSRISRPGISVRPSIPSRPVREIFRPRDQPKMRFAPMKALSLPKFKPSVTPSVVAAGFKVKGKKPKYEDVIAGIKMRPLF